MLDCSDGNIVVPGIVKHIAVTSCFGHKYVRIPFERSGSKTFHFYRQFSHAQIFVGLARQAQNFVKPPDILAFPLVFPLSLCFTLLLSSAKLQSEPMLAKSHIHADDLGLAVKLTAHNGSFIPQNLRIPLRELQNENPSFDSTIYFRKMLCRYRVLGLFVMLCANATLPSS